eukprot:5159024-Karenia_brevis.AAC.1
MAHGHFNTAGHASPILIAADESFEDFKSQDVGTAVAEGHPDVLGLITAMSGYGLRPALSDPLECGHE